MNEKWKTYLDLAKKFLLAETSFPNHGVLMAVGSLFIFGACIGSMLTKRSLLNSKSPICESTSIMGREFRRCFDVREIEVK